MNSYVNVIYPNNSILKLMLDEDNKLFQDNKFIKHIFSNIYVESSSQKAILLGKNGSMIKSIGTSSRKELEKEFDSKINLQLRVRVKKNWTNDVNLLTKYGYK